MTPGRAPMMTAWLLALPALALATIDFVTDPGVQPAAAYGVAWGDFDRDGDDDLFVSSSGSNALYRNNRGSLSDVTTPALAQTGVGGFACAWLDLNGDGLLDLYLATIEGPADMYLINRDGTAGGFSAFTVAASGPHADTLLFRGDAITVADFDGDLDIDIYIPRDESGRSSLLRFEAGPAFEALERSPVRSPVNQDAAVVVDANGDSAPDLAIIAAHNPMEFHVNSVTDPLNFARSDVGFLAREQGEKSAMTCDYNNDGLLDIFVSTDHDDRPPYVYRQEPDGTYTEVGASLGLTSDRLHTFGSVCQDFDADGYVDLFFCNVLPGQPHGVYRNRGPAGGFAFEKITDFDADLFEAAECRGVGTADYNGDGFLDVFVADCDCEEDVSVTSSRLFRNAGPSAVPADRSPIFLEIESLAQRFDAFGTIVVAHPAGDPNAVLGTRIVEVNHGWASQNSYKLHFGFQHAVVPDGVVFEISYPWATSKAVVPAINVIPPVADPRAFHTVTVHPPPELMVRTRLWLDLCGFEYRTSYAACLDMLAAAKAAGTRPTAADMTIVRQLSLMASIPAATGTLAVTARSVDDSPVRVREDLLSLVQLLLGEDLTALPDDAVLSETLLSLKALVAGVRGSEPEPLSQATYLTVCRVTSMLLSLAREQGIDVSQASDFLGPVIALRGKLDPLVAAEEPLCMSPSEAGQAVATGLAVGAALAEQIVVVVDPITIVVAPMSEDLAVLIDVPGVFVVEVPAGIGGGRYVTIVVVPFDDPEDQSSSDVVSVVVIDEEGEEVPVLDIGGGGGGGGGGVGGGVPDDGPGITIVFPDVPLIGLANKPADSEDCRNYRDLLEKCAFLNEETGEWDTRGLELERRPDGSVACRSSHLTDFAIVQRLSDETRNVCPVTFYGQYFALFATSLGLYAVALVATVGRGLFLWHAQVELSDLQRTMLLFTVAVMSLRVTFLALLLSAAAADVPAVVVAVVGSLPGVMMLVALAYMILIWGEILTNKTNVQSHKQRQLRIAYYVFVTALLSLVVGSFLALVGTSWGSSQESFAHFWGPVVVVVLTFLLAVSFAVTGYLLIRVMRRHGTASAKSQHLIARIYRMTCACGASLTANAALLAFSVILPDMTRSGFPVVYSLFLMSELLALLTLFVTSTRVPTDQGSSQQSVGGSSNPVGGSSWPTQSQTSFFTRSRRGTNPTTALLAQSPSSSIGGTPEVSPRAEAVDDSCGSISV